MFNLEELGFSHAEHGFRGRLEKNCFTRRFEIFHLEGGM